MVIRYGRLYGPGTYYASQAPSPPRIQVDEAARRTVAALDAASGVHAIVEDEGLGRLCEPEATRYAGTVGLSARGGATAPPRGALA